MAIKNHKKIQAKSRKYKVRENNDGTINVYHPTDSSRSYTVRIHQHGATCDCRWGQFRKWSDPRSGCKHVVRAYTYLNEEKNVYAHQSVEKAKTWKKRIKVVGDNMVLTF